MRVKKYRHSDKQSYLVELLLAITALLLLLAVFFFTSQKRMEQLLVLLKHSPQQEFPTLTYKLQQQLAAAAQSSANLADDLLKLELEPTATGRTLSTRLFFVVFNVAGQLRPLGLLREVPFHSSPLTRTIEMLLDGPQPSEINRGVHTMIPEASQLLNATLRNGVALLNFNDAFLKNIKVANVRWAQLRQVVFTATEFEGVNKVRFLIQGQSMANWGEINLEVALSRKDFF